LCLFVTAGGERLAVPAARVAEVVPAVRLHPAAGGSPWVAGLLRFRGAVTPVLDLDRGGAAREPRLSTRIVLLDVPTPAGPRRLGLLADRVSELREFAPAGPGYVGEPADGRPALGPLVADADGVVRVTDLTGLVPLAYPDAAGGRP
jgi:chemotaxis-related protein WspB